MRKNLATLASWRFYSSSLENVSTAFEDLFDLSEDLAAIFQPFLPRFQHALLDLTLYEPPQDEGDSDLQPILQLMKFVRNKQILQYFEWQAARRDAKITEILLGRFLLYALHADSDLDVEQIYLSLASNPELQKSTMSVAEKLLAKGRIEGIEKGLEKGLKKGRIEGRSEGYWMGRIQSLEEFLDLPQSSPELLGSLSLGELEARHGQLHGEYQRRFK